MWANNPLAVALSAAATITAASQIAASSVLLVSLGTGMAPSSASFSATATWIGAASDIVLMTSDGCSQSALGRFAAATSKQLTYGSIYTTKLLRRGIDIGAAKGHNHPRDTHRR